MQVPKGCPPPRIPSRSRNPADVKVVPPVQGLVPLSPSMLLLLLLPVDDRGASVDVGLLRRLNVDAILLTILVECTVLYVVELVES
jgi:hypothetical protein